MQLRFFWKCAALAGELGVALGAQAARRWTSQMLAVMSSADGTSSQPPSIHWKGQNRVAGWKLVHCV
jgi:hypothetical protein